MWGTDGDYHFQMSHIHPAFQPVSPGMTGNLECQQANLFHLWGSKNTPKSHQRTSVCRNIFKLVSKALKVTIHLSASESKHTNVPTIKSLQRNHKHFSFLSKANLQFTHLYLWCCNLHFSFWCGRWWPPTPRKCPPHSKPQLWSQCQLWPIHHHQVMGQCFEESHRWE